MITVTRFTVFTSCVQIDVYSCLLWWHNHTYIVHVLCLLYLGACVQCKVHCWECSWFGGLIQCWLCTCHCWCHWPWRLYWCDYWQWGMVYSYMKMCHTCSCGAIYLPPYNPSNLGRSLSQPLFQWLSAQKDWSMALGQAWPTTLQWIKLTEVHNISSPLCFCFANTFTCSFRISSALFGEVTVGVQGVCSCDCEMDRVSPCSKPCSAVSHECGVYSQVVCVVWLVATLHQYYSTDGE